ncbi:YjbQ family protein [Clostridium arbusti]|uniref:YjbQ family protein n=1 Tax=Clostridium arbusti TaxID=1137848 RepID=UPI0002893D31|nr:YjbQ family protein [Clostridium arbusti]
MVVYNDELILRSNGNRVSYFEITNKIREIVAKSGVKNGICVVVSPHTTCSVFFEEYSHDRNYTGDEYLQVDLNNTFEKILPRCLSDGQYYHPGPEHTAFGDTLSAEYVPDSDHRALLNTEAHLKGTFIGSSETFIIQDSKLQIGGVGYIYFVDWDQNRVRDRHCKVQILGE